jgi:WD40 repeat protein
LCNIGGIVDQIMLPTQESRPKLKTPPQKAKSRLEEAFSSVPVSLRWILAGLLLLFVFSTCGVLLLKNSNVSSQDPSVNANKDQILDKPTWSTLNNTLTAHNGPVFSLAFSPDGTSFFSGSGDRTIKQWNTQAATVQQTLLGHKNSVVSVAVSPDAQTLVSGGRDKSVQVWNLETGQRIHNLATGKGWVKAVAVSPDSQLLASGNDDSTLTVWQLKTGKTLRTIMGNQEGIEAIAFNPQGTLLASSGEDRTIKLWDVKTGQLRLTLKENNANEGHPESILFASDGQTLLSGDQAGIHQWNVFTGKVMRLFPDSSRLVRSLALSPDGRTLVSGHADNTVKTWNLSTGEPINTFTGHRDWVLTVAISPDGQSIISGSRDKTIKRWPLWKPAIDAR